MTDNFSRQEPIKESGHAPDETLGDTFQSLNEQLLAERVKMQALLKEKEDLQKSRAYRFIRWFWQLRMKVIPNGSKLARYLSLGPQEISYDETTGHQSISDLAYRYSTDSADGKFYIFARKLNTDLFVMVNKIPQDEIDILWSSLESVLVDKYRATPSDLEAWYWHRYRI